MLEVSFDKTMGNFTLQSSFSSDRGVLGILGSSGCGKSLTLKCIAGLYSPDKGQIKLNGKELFNSDAKVNIPPRKRNIGYVFQNYALFPHLTVYKNIAYGVKHLDKKTRYDKIVEMIGKMQLSGLENHYPSQLSGGQQQRVALARTLITEPELLLLDEPFSAIDSNTKYLLEDELLSIIRNNYHGIVLLVTHNIEEAYRLCDRILIIDKGKTLQIGQKEEIIRSPSSLTAARITGCKNFLNVDLLGEEDGYLVIKSKELVLRARKTATELQPKMVAGVRAHDLRISSKFTNEPNTFECEVIEKIEGIFSTTIIVNCRGNIFQVEVSKYNCPHLTNCKCKKLMLHIPADRIFLVNSEQNECN
ncbi:sulfate/molybdate ABC transporter ATP-binding protein [Petroclostridium xylanilyticum]|jgi:molybdate transport system ATP-binding protein|uniref:sulfate/molybdate ABC transporter ATP-binding protein n=1 Tax=Petroclostridium xylanilyticum TaxID=1792311 RepID=UPI000B987AE3|nr:ABC transporter ATP-binding protein [Petroclostridium xylanilyticum]